MQGKYQLFLQETEKGVVPKKIVGFVMADQISYDCKPESKVSINILI